MTEKEKLIASASDIPLPSPSTLEAYKNVTAAMIPKMNEIMLQVKELQLLIQSANKEKMLLNHANHMRFMESIMSKYDPSVFVTTILWVYKTYRKHEFPESYWKHAFPVYEKLLYEYLDPPLADEIAVFYLWLRKNHKNFLKVSAKEEN